MLLLGTAVLVSYFLLIEVFEVRREGAMNYFSNMWNMMDWAGFILFFFTFVAFEVITVSGPGGYLGGHYLISRVLHKITNCSYRQQLTLRRNARSDADNSGGGLLGGVI